MGRGLDGLILRFIGELCSFEGPRAVRAAGAAAGVGLEQFPVAIAWGKHLFPFRTEQLSPTAPMVLGSQGPGRVGRRRFLLRAAFGRLVLVNGPQRLASELAAVAVGAAGTAAADGGRSSVRAPSQWHTELPLSPFGARLYGSAERCSRRRLDRRRPAALTLDAARVPAPPSRRPRGRARGEAPAPTALPSARPRLGVPAPDLQSSPEQHSGRPILRRPERRWKIRPARPSSQSGAPCGSGPRWRRPADRRGADLGARADGCRSCAHVADDPAGGGAGARRWGRWTARAMREPAGEPVPAVPRGRGLPRPASRTRVPCRRPLAPARRASV